MKRIDLNRDWYFKRGTSMLLQSLAAGDFGKKVQLPHDYMIESDVTEDAPAKAASGYYTEGVATYTKLVEIPAEWEGEKVFLHFDGVMMNASVRVNGGFAGIHHYGYTPFTLDITDALYYGEENRIEVVVNPSMQPNSRWYSGAGIYRGVSLSHVPGLHLIPDAIFAYTKRLEGISEEGETAKEAFLMAEVTVQNELAKDHQVKVCVELGSASGSSVLFVKAGRTAVARVALRMENPMLWDAEHPHLYQVKATLQDMGEFGVHLKPERALKGILDEEETLFGIRTISADSTHGLRVNGKSVKVKGGCIHHDNGILGAVSLYDAEERKISLLKSSGFNTVRMAHNPPSKELLEVCDRLGMYVFDEAFDAWRFSKQPGDYSQYFEDHWQEDMEAFLRRDRNHPSILFWSTGNEVEERGGMGDGYAVAEELAAFVRRMDGTRLVTNGLCSMWSGTDDKTAKKTLQKMQQSMAADGSVQNVDVSGKEDRSWEETTEAFANCLDVVGYNYLDEHYAYDHERYPERVILGTESYPNEFDKVWALVEDMSHVIGDCTWTAFDYIGEAGIGKSGFFAKDDPLLKKGAFALSSHSSEYPWRLANDADYTIGGVLTAQGVFRKIVWGSRETGLFTRHPKYTGMEEIVSAWGWPQVHADWNYAGYEQTPVKVYVYSAASEVEVFLNGKSLGRACAGKEHRFTAVFEVPYEAGTLTAVSYEGGAEVSKTTLETTGAPAALSLHAEKTALQADGKQLAFVRVEILDSEGRLVPNAEVKLHAEVLSDPEADGAYLAGFGSDNPITEENYTSGTCTSYHGRALAILRAGYAPGKTTLKVRAEGSGESSVTLTQE